MLSLSCLAQAASAAAAVTAPKTWDAYGNARFNFAVCHPPAFKGRGEADNADGQRFRTADGAELAAFGSNRTSGDKIDSDLADSVKELAGADARVTYRAQKSNWLVVSGVGGKGEFYLKRVLRREQVLSWEFVYPARLHARYAPMTAKMISCFTVGSEDGY